MKTVTTLEVADYTCECPECGAEERGFCGDARGEVVTCDGCGEEYHIHPAADFEFL